MQFPFFVLIPLISLLCLGCGPQQFPISKMQVNNSQLGPADTLQTSLPQNSTLANPTPDIQNAPPDLVPPEPAMETPQTTLEKVDPAPVPQTPSPAPKEKTSPFLPVAEQKTSAFQITEKGFTKPTIYFHAVIDEDHIPCGKNSDLTNSSGKSMISVCRATEATCRMEGSCTVIQNGKKRSFNIADKSSGRYRYFETTTDSCRFGYGVESTCLDPYYSVAADPSIYSPGDVIYIPSVTGLELPDKSQHAGYFIVRDRGNKVHGKGRFDFYSGFFDWKDRLNPFNKIGFANISTHVPYYVIRGELAKKVLLGRSFPRIP